jgi:hypothetical protein
MLRETALEIQRRNFPQATVLQMAASHLAFAPTFFAAVRCGLAVFLFHHFEQTFSEMLRVKEVP